MITIAIIIVIIILVFLLYYNNMYSDTFSLKPFEGATGYLNLEEEVVYQSCTGCLNANGMLKPNFKYNISDVRCLKNITNNYIPSNSLDGIVTYKNGPTSEYTSCLTSYNSMYSYVTGRYIRIENNSVLRISHISVHPRETSLPSLSSMTGTFIYTNSLYNNLYPNTVLDSSNKSFQTTGSGYIIIDLGSNINIGYINIKHDSVADANTLIGATLYVLTDSGNVDYGNIVFTINITTNDLNRIIYTQNFTSSTGLKPVTDSFIWPCTGCTGYNSSNLIKNYNYYYGNMTGMTGVRCFKPRNYTNVSNLVNAINGDKTIDTYFASCSTITETRYISSNGRYIRLVRNDNTALQDIKLTTMIAMSYGTQLVPIMAHAQPCLNSLYGEYLIDGNSTTFAGASGLNAYLEIDLGTDIDVTSIVIISPTTFNDLAGTTLYVIKNDGTITGLVTIIANSSTTQNIPTYNTGLYGTYSFNKLYATPTISLPLNTLPFADASQNKFLVSNNGITLNVSNLLFSTQSAYLNGGSGTSYMDIITNKLIIPANTDYTIQAWINYSGLNNSIGHAIFELGNGITGVGGGITMRTMSNSSFGQLYINGVNTTVNLMPLLTVNTWIYVTLNRTQTSATTTITKLYTGASGGVGVQKWSSNLYSGAINSGGGNLRLFNLNMQTAYPFNGYIREFRIIIGRALDGTIIPTEPHDINPYHEVFNYTECKLSNRDCINTLGYTKPNMKYNLNDGRCVIAKQVCNQPNCLDQLNNYSMSLNNIVLNFDSCYPGYSSQFSTIFGRYIRIRRINGSSLPLSFKSIKVYNKYGIPLSSTLTPTFAKPLYNNLYGKYLVDDDPITITTTGSATASTDNSDAIYIQLDLESDMEIGSIDIDPDLTLMPTLINVELVISKADTVIVYKKDLSSV